MLNFQLFAVVTETVKSEKLAKEFIVKVNERGSLYTKELLKLIEKFETIGNKRGANKIGYGDYIVFQKNRVSVETDSDSANDLDLPIYKLTDSFDKIQKLVKNFFNNVFTSKSTYYPCDYCPYAKQCKYGDSDIIRDGEYVTFEEKVTINPTYVKVGYEAYKIKTAFSGRRFVTIEDEKFEVKSDYKGKYLKLVE